MRNRGAMLGDPSVREGYVQGAVARGIENAGSNQGGATAGFVGMGLGMNAAGSFMQSASQTNAKQMEQEKNENGWKCSCGETNTGNFCQSCGAKKPSQETWTCSCGSVNTGNFCPNCGAKKPEETVKFCPDCGTKNTGKFCQNCGKKL